MESKALVIAPRHTVHNFDSIPCLSFTVQGQAPVQAVKQAATGQFGSGWVWVAVDRSDYDVAPTDPEALIIVATPNQVISRNPL